MTEADWWRSVQRRAETLAADRSQPEGRRVTGVLGAMAAVTALHRLAKGQPSGYRRAKVAVPRT